MSGGDLALTIAIGLALVIGGIVALRRTRGRAALVLLPLIFVGLLFGAAPSSAQAADSCNSTPPPPAVCVAATALPSATVSDEWLVDDGFVNDLISEVPDESAQAAMASIEAIDGFTFGVIVSMGTDGVDPDVGPMVVVADADDHLIGTNPTYQVQLFKPNMIAAALAVPMNAWGDLPVRVVLSYSYPDGCGGILTTNFTYDGTISNPEPVG